MKIKLSLKKSINENAAEYFDKAKKLKNKLPGLEKALQDTQKKLTEFKEKKEHYSKQKSQDEHIKLHKKKEWYDKFRNTFTSSGLLCVLGNDSTTNEILVKKHLEKEDLAMHTEAPASPFCIIKNARDTISKEELYEVAQLVGAFSSQWKKGFGTADIFWVYPEQLSKEAQSGEYLKKGSFMVRGTKNFIKNVSLRICLGIQSKEIEGIEYEELFSGSESACKLYCKNRYIKLDPGDDNYKKLTKEFKKRLKFSKFEDLPKYIPNNCKIAKR